MMALRFVRLVACIEHLSVAIKLRKDGEAPSDASLILTEDEDDDFGPDKFGMWPEAYNHRLSSFSLDADPLKIWNSEQRGHAFFPFGHAGARKRLHDKLRRAKAGEHLRIVTLGGSMTAGHGCPFGRTNDQGEPWPNVTEKLLKKTLPSVSITNLASPGTTSTYPLANADAVASAAPDIVIVDYAINDAVGDGNDMSTTQMRVNAEEVTRIQNVTSTLIRLLLSMPTKPAVVYLETFTHSTMFGYTCAHRSSEFPHWPILRSLDVPSVSYSEAACSVPGRAQPTTQLFDDEMKNVWLSMYGTHIDPHCKCWVHRAVGHLMAGFFISSVKDADAPDTEADHPAAALVADVGSACTLHPAMKHVAFKLWRPRPLSEEHFPARHHDGTWFFGEDVQSKPGWIARAGAPGLITFDVQTRAGANAAVVMEYLTSYQNVGEVTCWLDEDSHKGLKFNALKHDRVSLIDMATVEFPANTTAGTHAFHCRSDGNKFKITSLRSC